MMRRSKNSILAIMLLAAIGLSVIGAVVTVYEWKNLKTVPFHSVFKEFNIKEVDETIKLDPKLSTLAYADGSDYRYINLKLDPSLGKDEIKLSGYYDSEFFSDYKISVGTNNEIVFTIQDYRSDMWPLSTIKKLGNMLKQGVMVDQYQPYRLSLSMNKERYKQLEESMDIKRSACDDHDDCDYDYDHDYN